VPGDPKARVLPLESYTTPYEKYYETLPLSTIGDVIYQNHLPMLADSPSAYRNQPGWKFLALVPVTWDETRVLQAEMGKCLIIARRSGEDWYIGGMTAGEERALELPLDFLGDGTFRAGLYLDNPKEGLTALTVREQTVSKTATINLGVPRSGGFAARIGKRRG
jgi:alpha-glucosidase